MCGPDSGEPKCRYVRVVGCWPPLSVCSEGAGCYTDPFHAVLLTRHLFGELQSLGFADSSSLVVSD